MESTPTGRSRERESSGRLTGVVGDRGHPDKGRRGDSADAGRGEADVAGPTVNGYRLILPPGWQRIPLRGGTKQTVDGILDRSFEGLPRDRYGPIRHELEARLWRQIRAAQQNNGLDLYLPVELVHGRALAASIVVAEVRFDTGEEVPAAEVVAALVAASAGTVMIELDGSPAVRTERVVRMSEQDAEVAKAEGGDEAEMAEQAEVQASRRVDLTIPAPGETRRWLAVSFSTLGDGNPSGAVADLLVELFDAMMTTFRWRIDDCAVVLE